MSKSFIMAAMLSAMGSSSAFAQSVTEHIKVAGNCGMCAKHIETAAKAAGAETASWNKKTKVLTIVYDHKKTTNGAIQQKIAAAGYDTEKFPGDMTAYGTLDECCQYDHKQPSTTKH